MNNLYIYKDMVLARFLRFSFDIDFYPTEKSYMLHNDGNKMFYTFNEFYDAVITSVPDILLIDGALNGIFN